VWSWPTFASKQEAEEYLKQASVQAALRTNPEYPLLRHLFPLLINWSQVKRFLLEPRRVLLLLTETGHSKRKRTLPLPLPLPLLPRALMQPALTSLSLPFHARMSAESTENTLKYLFFHMRCGIYVMIRGGRVQMFVPFVNDRYVNTWSGAPAFAALDVDDYYSNKRHQTGMRENVLGDKSRWWSNGNMVCNEPPDNVWGDHLLCQLKDMLDTTCAHHDVPDVEFFINKRDFPHLRANYTEPYDFLFDEKDRPVTGERFDTLAPILSFYTAPTFADIALPCSEDWEGATGRVFLRAAGDLFTPANRARFDVPWSGKVETAFFRGSATGAGVTPDTNQRLRLALLSHEWSAAAAAAAAPPLLDAGITSWNVRDKKRFGEPLCYIRPSLFPFKKAPYVPMYEQARYKYLLYVEGHCAANRYAFLMSIGCVILKVASTTEAADMWYFPLLQPYVDHVPVAADLSNLAAQIQWCREHDAECEQIARRAQELHRAHLGVSGICNYLAALFGEIHARQGHAHQLMEEGWFGYASVDSGIPPPMRPRMVKNRG
jgi:hypothetical protein